MGNKQTTVVALWARLQQATPMDQEIRGEDDPFAKQRFYERWVREDQWLFRTQGIPLLLSIDPERWCTLVKDDELQSLELNVWSAIVDQVNDQGQSLVVNLQEGDQSWQVSPAKLCQWARVNGIEVPEALEQLVQFIAKTISLGQTAEPDPTVGKSPSGTTMEATTSDREKLLGAALNILAKCPDQCCDEYGLASGEAIVGLIQDQSVRWFDTLKPPLSKAQMVTVIDKWLE